MFVLFYLDLLVEERDNVQEESTICYLFYFEQIRIVIQTYLNFHLLPHLMAVKYGDGYSVDSYCPF